MGRYALLIEYDGRTFAGWQRQSDVTTVQGEIEAALDRLTGAGATIQGAGRTDAGVHAAGQVAHVDLDTDWGPFRLSEALNYHLKPAPIAIVRAWRVADDFHARFSAVERRYLYRVISRRAPLTYLRGQVWRVGYELDVAAMQEAADLLVGTHDFTTFRSSICQAKSPVKSLDEARVEQVAGPMGPEIHFHFRARSFLHNQVRSFVGTLERVGAGRWDVGRVGEALASADRAACGPVAPPDGLYLMEVGY